MEGTKGKEAHEVDFKAGETWTQAHYDAMHEKYQRETIEHLGRLAKEDKPFFLQYWPLYPLNFVYPDQSISRNGGFMADKMEQLDDWVGDLMAKVDEVGVAENTLVVVTSDNGPWTMFEVHAGTAGPLRGEKGTSWEGGFRVPLLAKWPGVIKPGTIYNNIISHEDWAQTLLAAAGEPDIKDKLKKGVKVGEKTFKNHLDGYNFLPYLTGEEEKGPRPGFMYFSDDGELVCLRYDNWKLVFGEQRTKGTLQIWQEPFVSLRIPKIFNLRTDPYERADITSNTYWDWVIDHAWILYPMADVIGPFLKSFEAFPPAQKPGSFTIGDAFKTMQAVPQQ